MLILLYKLGVCVTLNYFYNNYKNNIFNKLFLQ